MKVVYCFNASSIFIYQNPNLRSKQEKCPAPTKLSNTSCILGRGRSPFLYKHSSSKSQCRTIGHHPSSSPTPLHCTKHSGWAGWHQTLNISHRWFQTSSTNGRGIHLNHSLKGVSSVTFIVCSME